MDAKIHGTRKMIAKPDESVMLNVFRILLLASKALEHKYYYRRKSLVSMKIFNRQRFFYAYRLFRIMKPNVEFRKCKNARKTQIFYQFLIIEESKPLHIQFDIAET